MSAPPIVHHVSASDPRGVLHHALRCGSFPATFWRFRGLVWNFFERDLMSRFHGSYLGVLWVLVQPLFMFAVYYTIFGLFLGPRGSDGAPDPRFPFWLFSGFILFSTFVEATSSALRIVVGNANLVKKVSFPCELLPLTPVLSAMVVYLVGCALLAAVGIPLGQVHVGVELLVWPVVFALLVVMSLGVALLLASCYVFMRDLMQLYGLLTTALFFLSPIFWFPDLPARQLGAGVLDWLVVNPVYNLLLCQRLTFGITTQELVPLVGGLGDNLWIATLFSLGLFALGYGVFISQKHKFADLI